MVAALEVEQIIRSPFFVFLTYSTHPNIWLYMDSYDELRYKHAMFQQFYGTYIHPSIFSPGRVKAGAHHHSLQVGSLIGQPKASLNSCEFATVPCKHETQRCKD
jgi:hypothetical protein